MFGSDMNSDNKISLINIRLIQLSSNINATIGSDMDELS